MKITVQNDSDEPCYIKFENDADLNMNPGADAAMEIEDGSELFVKSDHIETKNIKRP